MRHRTATSRAIFPVVAQFQMIPGFFWNAETQSRRERRVSSLRSLCALCALCVFAPLRFQKDPVRVFKLSQDQISSREADDTGNTEEEELRWWRALERTHPLGHLGMQAAMPLKNFRGNFDRRFLHSPQRMNMRAPFEIFRSLAFGIYLKFGMWNLECFPR